MAPLKPGSVAWLDTLASLKALQQRTPVPSSAEMAKTLNVSSSLVRYLMGLARILDPEAVQKIRQAAQAEPPFTLSYKAALPLAGLKDKAAVQEALDMILAHRLKTMKIAALVEWMNRGNKAQDFDHTRYKRGWNKGPEAQEEPVETSSKANAEDVEDGDAKPAEAPKPSKVKGSAKTPKDGSGPSLLAQFFAGLNPVKGVQKKVKKGEEISKTETALLAADDLWTVSKAAWKGGGKHIFFWFVKLGHTVGKAVAKALAPVHHSKGSGGAENLFTLLLHGVLYLICVWGFYGFFIGLFLPFTRRFVEYPLYFVAHFVFNFPTLALYWATHHLIEAAAIVLVIFLVWLFVPAGKRLTALVVLGVLAGLWWFGRNSSGMSNPWDHTETASAPATVQSIPTPIAEPHFAASATKKSAQPSSPAPRPQVEAQALVVPVPKKEPVQVPSTNTWTPAMESRALLDQEIDAIPEGGLVTSAAVAINEGISGDMAMSRLGDMVSDDYCLIVNGSKQKMTAVTPTTLSLLVTVANGNPLGGILGSGSNSQGLYWEDVLAIHCDEVTETTTLGKFYQVTLIATNHKQPFIVQCQTEDEMNHLVSSLEWFLRTARNGKNVEVTSIPIPNQGMALNKDGQVKVMWDASPAFKSLISWGDYVWSVDGKAHPDVPTLEKTLNGLPSGQHTLYAVAKDDWDKALIKQRQTNGIFNPALEVLKLVVP